MAVRILAGLAELAGRYDAAILDSWGVLHDGVRPYPGVLECLARMRAAGWQMVVASNAPRAGESVRRQVEGFGVPAEAYDGIVTSGDLTRAALRERADAWHASLGRRFYHLGPDRDHGLLDGLDLEQVAGPEDCDFILNTGLFDDESETEADYAAFLVDAKRRGLPMLCANPDIEVSRGGKSIPCAGAVAKAYEELGGDVAHHGKPHPAAFRECLALLPGIAAGRVLVAGDSLRTDIVGAKMAGIDALFVTGGIHAGEFGPDPDASPDTPPDPVAVAAALNRAGAPVVAAVSHLVW